MCVTVCVRVCACLYLQAALAFHAKDGIAGERLVTDTAVFQAIVTAAQQASHNNSVGGNAALMARRFAELPGTSVLLGGVVGSELRTLLGTGVSIVSPGGDASVKDEVHLILEYASGDAVLGVSAPRANRFIVSSDRSNGSLAFPRQPSFC